MSAYEFGQWWALYRADPWGELRADIGSGIVASTLANIHRAQGVQPFGPLDFCPYLKPREAPQEMTARDMMKERPHG